MARLNLEAQLSFGTLFWFLSDTDSKKVTGNRRLLSDINNSLKIYSWSNYDEDTEKRVFLTPLSSWDDNE